MASTLLCHLPHRGRKCGDARRIGKPRFLHVPTGSCCLVPLSPGRTFCLPISLDTCIMRKSSEICHWKPRPILEPRAMNRQGSWGTESRALPKKRHVHFKANKATGEFAACSHQRLPTLRPLKMTVFRACSKRVLITSFLLLGPRRMNSQGFSVSLLPTMTKMCMGTPMPGVKGPVAQCMQNGLVETNQNALVHSKGSAKISCLLEKNTRPQTPDRRPTLRRVNAGFRNLDSETSGAPASAPPRLHPTITAHPMMSAHCTASSLCLLSPSKANPADSLLLQECLNRQGEVAESSRVAWPSSARKIAPSVASCSGQGLGGK